MRQIQQQTQSLIDSCAATCVAMLAGVPAKLVEETLNEKYHKGEVSIDAMLAAYDISCERMYTDEPVRFGSVYLVLAPSLAQPGRFHMLILDARSVSNCKVYDPGYNFRDGSYETAHYYWPEEEPPMRKGVQLSSFIPVVRIKGDEWYE